LLKEISMARFNCILTQSANGVKTIILNRPEKRNALSRR
jgi:enoyl-CoA hydratase/carnithine racemase